MATDFEIKTCKQMYADHTDAQLIQHTHELGSETARHIAAQQLLAERREKKEVERQQRIEDRLEELKKPHWTVKPTFWIAIISAIAAIVAAYFAWRALPRS
jgi:hypothetical protein